MLCRGKIIRVDSKIVFKAEEPTRIIRISHQNYVKDPRKHGDYVSYKAVDPSRVYEGQTKVYFEDSSGCIVSGKVMRKLENSYMLKPIDGKKTFRKQASKVHYYADQGTVAH